MAGPIAKTQPNPADRPQQVGDLQPEVSRQFDDLPPSDVTQQQPQSQAGTPHLVETATHPTPGVSSNINTGPVTTPRSGRA